MRLYEELDFLSEQKRQAERDLVHESRKHAIVSILETAPGFGPIRAARLVPIVANKRLRAVLSQVRADQQERDRQRLAHPKLTLRQKDRIRAAQARADAPALSRAAR